MAAPLAGAAFLATAAIKAAVNFRGTKDKEKSKDKFHKDVAATEANIRKLEKAEQAAFEKNEAKRKK